MVQREEETAYNENIGSSVQEKPPNHLRSILQRKEARFQAFLGSRNSYA